MISTITATQVYKVISPIVRKNVTDLIIFKLRNYADLEGIVEELSALTDNKIIKNISSGCDFTLLEKIRGCDKKLSTNCPMIKPIIT